MSSLDPGGSTAVDYGLNLSQEVLMKRSAVVEEGADGIIYEDETVPAGTVVTVKAAPTRSGYTFKDWDDGTSYYDPDDTVSVNSDITFKAKWHSNGGGGSVIMQYTLTYETNGGNRIKSELHTKGVTVELKKIPVKESYVFEG